MNARPNVSTTDDTTTLICLFHHKDQGQAALQEILRAGVPDQNVTIIGGFGSGIRADESSLSELNVPQKDLKHLLDGIREGGVLVTVSAISGYVAEVERIFASHQAGIIDETVVADDMTDRAMPFEPLSTTPQGATIPVIEEEFAVGKRTVDAGAVRVYRRVVEIPVEASVRLAEEHVSVDRKPVDRIATAADLNHQGDRTIELVETSEQVVVGKEAHVVEEVVVGKQVIERVEHIHDTVRRTEVEVEEITPVGTTRPSR